MCQEFVCKYAVTCVYDICEDTPVTRLCHHELCGLCRMAPTCTPQKKKNLGAEMRLSPPDVAPVSA